MHGEWLVVMLSLAAACGFAAASTLKHLSAGHAPDAQGFHRAQLGGFVRVTLSHPLWLAGVGCDLLGGALQIVALHLGSLTVVQPLLITGLLFALVLRPRFEHRRITGPQFVWAVLLTASLAGFLLLAGRGQPGTNREAADRLPAVVAGVLGALLAAACVELGRRQRGPGQAAALLGVAVGIIDAGIAALLKAVSNVAVRDRVDVLISWQLYAVIVLGVGGLLLSQLAFQAGPIAASLPATATINPLLSIVVGVLVYDEHLRRGPGAGTLLVILLLVLSAAVLQLARAADNTAGSTGEAGVTDPKAGADRSPLGACAGKHSCRALAAISPAAPSP